MKKCKEHRVQFSEGYPGCAYCLAKEVKQLKDTLTRCQRDGTTAVNARRDATKALRKAEWDLAKLQDEGRKSAWNGEGQIALAQQARQEIAAMEISEEEYDAAFDGTNSDKWEPPSRSKMSRIYRERDKLKDELLRLADGYIVRQVGKGKEWPALEIAARHIIEKYRGPTPVNTEMLKTLKAHVEPDSINPEVLLALCTLRDDFKKIGAMGWHGRVVEIINLMTGKES